MCPALLPLAAVLQVKRLEQQELRELVVAAVNNTVWQPAAVIQAFMDHSYSAYAFDLEAASAAMRYSSKRLTAA